MPQVGQGILKGMGVTLKHLFGQKITRQYPEYKRPLPERSRGMLTVDMDRCIACLQCMRICPDHCISIEQEKRDAALATSGDRSIANIGWLYMHDAANVATPSP